MIMKRFIVLAAPLLLVGCSTFSSSAPQDWHQVGYQDGARGVVARSYAQLGNISATQQSEYDDGYNEGVRDYCHPNFAYQIGISGQQYQGVCGGMKQGQKFRLEWQRGYDVYQNSAM